MKTESELREDELKEMEKLVKTREDPTQFCYEDDQIRNLAIKFVKVAFLLDRDEQEQFSRLYIRHIAGVDLNEPGWSMRLGLRMNGGREKPLQDGPTFWKELVTSIPEIFIKEEVDLLIRRDPTAGGAFDLLCLMSFSSPTKSALLQRMMNSIIAWK